MPLRVLPGMMWVFLYEFNASIQHVHSSRLFCEALLVMVGGSSRRRLDNSQVLGVRVGRSDLRKTRVSVCWFMIVLISSAGFDL
jgi:hypothetical protein